MISIKITPKYKPPKAERVKEKKAKGKKNKFANAIIILCVVIGLLITAATIVNYYMLKTAIPGDVLSALILFWGGELLIIALRQVLGSDITKKNYTEDNVI